MQIDGGSIHRCHQEQILIRFGPEPEQSEECKHDQEEDLTFPSSHFSDAVENHKQGSENMGLSKDEILTEPVAPAVLHQSESQSRIVRTLRSVTRPPDRYIPAGVISDNW